MAEIKGTSSLTGALGLDTPTAAAAITGTPIPAQPITVTDVKQAKLRAGDTVPAPLAPKSGTIPYSAGTVVALVVKKFTQSWTIRVALGVVIFGVLAGLNEFRLAADAALAAGHHVFQIPWPETGFRALDAAYRWIGGGGLIVVLKLMDNDPANPPGSGAGKDEGES